MDESLKCCLLLFFFAGILLIKQNINLQNLWNFVYILILLLKYLPNFEEFFNVFVFLRFSSFHFTFTYVDFFRGFFCRKTECQQIWNWTKNYQANWSNIFHNFSHISRILKSKFCGQFKFVFVGYFRYFNLKY